MLGGGLLGKQQRLTHEEGGSGEKSHDLLTVQWKVVGTYHFNFPNSMDKNTNNDVYRLGRRPGEQGPRLRIPC